MPQTLVARQAFVYCVIIVSQNEKKKTKRIEAQYSGSEEVKTNGGIHERS